MFYKPLEYWAVLLGMVIYVGMKNADTDSLRKRIGKTGASALLAIGFAPELAVYTRNSETIAAAVIMSLGLILLDAATALIMDREFIKEMVRKKLGGGE